MLLDSDGDSREFAGDSIDFKIGLEDAYYNGTLSLTSVPNDPSILCPKTWTTHMDASISINGTTTLSSSP